MTDSSTPPVGALYGPGARDLQERFDSRRIADRLADITVHDFLDAGELFDHHGRRAHHRRCVDGVVISNSRSRHAMRRAISLDRVKRRHRAEIWIASAPGAEKRSPARHILKKIGSDVKTVSRKPRHSAAAPFIR